jgi:hypothetical protein
VETKNKYIQISGKQLLLDDIKIGDNINLNVDVIKSEISDNHDGTYDITYKAKLFGVGEGQKNISLKGKSPSKELRRVLFSRWEKLGVSMDFEDWYPKKMEQIIEDQLR